MKTLIYQLICVALISLLLPGCGNRKKEGTPKEIVDVVIGENTGVNISAMGVEFDPHFFSQNAHSIDPESWPLLVKRVRDMGIQRLRVMVLPEWFEPVNDNDDPHTINWNKLTFESGEMHSLYKVLDMAEEIGIEVTLVVWGCSTGMDLIDKPQPDPGPIHFLAQGNEGNDWVIGTKKHEEFAENFSILVQYLLHEKKYTCIREVTPINEPSWAFVVDNQVDKEGYLKLCRALDARFRMDGIRDKVLFNLSDDAENIEFLEMSTTQLNDIADKFNSHTYKFGYETPNSEILEWERANQRLTKAVGKEHFIGEFGSNQTVGSSRQKDIDYYERGVLMPRIAINLLNAGANGVSYWSLIDEYYHRTNPYPVMQQLGLWRAKKEVYESEPYYDSLKEDYQVRPNYHGFSMLTRFIKPGDEVYPLNLQDEFATASALKNKEGKWTYFFVNGNDEDLTVKFSVPEDERGEEFDVYRYVREELPDGDNMIPVSETVKAKTKLNIFLPKQSVVVYKQR